MTKIATFLMFLIGLILFFGCERKVSLTPNEEKLAVLHGNLLDLYNRIKLHGTTSDSIYSFKSDSIIKKFNLTKLDFENEIKKLEGDPYKWKIFIAKSLEVYDEIKN